MATSSAIEATRWTNDLLASLGRAANSHEHALQITGSDPVIATRFRAGEGAASVLAANATAAADLWCARGGRPQTIEVDVRAAAASLVSFAYLRYHGAPFNRRGQATTALYRARDDRWVHLHGGFSSREGTLALLECDDDAKAITSAVASWDAQALEDALAARGVRCEIAQRRRVACASARRRARAGAGGRDHSHRRRGARANSRTSRR